MTIFGQLIIGPPGSGKTTYCCESEKCLKDLKRNVAIINLDPANDNLPYTPIIDINEFITVQDVMEYLGLGPNGALLYCMEFVEEYADNIAERIKNKTDHYFLIDCPGQVELYTNHDSIKCILKSFEKIDFRLCCVNLIDSHYCSDVNKYISTLLMSSSAMLHLALPHVNVLSKIDLVEKYGEKLKFKLNYYTEVLDLAYLIDSSEDSLSSKYHELSKKLASVIEDYSLVQFIPANIKDPKFLLRIQNAVDKANGYIFKYNEEKNVQELLNKVMCNMKYDCDIDV